MNLLCSAARDQLSRANLLQRLDFKMEEMLSKLRLRLMSRFEVPCPKWADPSWSPGGYSAASFQVPSAL